jgi:hypothetical protein
MAGLRWFGIFHHAVSISRRGKYVNAGRKGAGSSPLVVPQASHKRSANRRDKTTIASAALRLSTAADRPVFTRLRSHCQAQTR